MTTVLRIARNGQAYWLPALILVLALLAVPVVAGLTAAASPAVSAHAAPLVTSSVPHDTTCGGAVLGC
jgi:hypothetical protein